jgi:hypothetical protein
MLKKQNVKSATNCWDISTNEGQNGTALESKWLKMKYWK